MPLISLKNVTKTYTKKGAVIIALRNISLDIGKGEFVAILGPSGCGKSTLLHILGLLDRSDTGEYSLLNFDVLNQSDNALAVLRNKMIGFVFQSYNLIPLLTVEENIELPLLYSSEPPQNSVSQLMGKLNIETRKDHKPSELSGGQQQRVAIARAISNNPAVILADEPTGNLDTRSSQEIISIFKEMNKQGVTIILVTHDMEIAKQASRILELKDGTIVADTVRSSPAITLKPDEASGKMPLSKKMLNLSCITQQLGAAYQSMCKRKLKTFLALFAIAISVSFSVLIFALGDGLKQSIFSNMGSLDAGIIELRPKERAGGRLSFADLKAISGENISAVYPVTMETGVLEGNDTEVKAVVYAMSKVRLEQKRVTLLAGGFFADSNPPDDTRQIILFEKTAQMLFGQAEKAVKHTININGKVRTVAGVIACPPQSRIRLEMPKVSALVMYDPNTSAADSHLIFAEVKLRDAATVDSAKTEIENKIKTAHGLNLQQQSDIDVLPQAVLINGMKSGFRFFDRVIMVIIIITLILGGIGVMNIMLANFAERTREIGIRKTVGATNINIFTQYLGESIFLCFIGGAAGFITGLLISRPVSKFLTISPHFDLFHIASVLFMISCVGIIFGLYPAARAAKLDPIIALRD